MKLKLWSQEPGRGWPGAQGMQWKCRTIQVQKGPLRGFQRDGAKVGTARQGGLFCSSGWWHQVKGSVAKERFLEP